MPDAVHIFISGYYGYANSGDEAILTVLLRELRQNILGAEIAVLSGTPEETAETHAVRAVLWSDPLAIAEAVQAADIVITGGGGIFHDYGGFAPEGLLSEGNWGLGFHVTAGLLAALLGKPHVIYGAGVGPLFTSQGRDYVRAVCAGASSISVRDEASAALLKDIGVPAERVRVTADPAFLFEHATPDRAIEIFAAEGVPGAELLVGVTLRHWAHEVDREAWEKEMAAGLDLFLKRHQEARVVFLPFQHFEGEQEDDLRVARSVHESMELRNRADVLQGRYTPAEKAALLGRCNLVAAMRLHAVIFSAAAGVPFIAVTYDEKVRQVLRRLGRAELGIETTALRAPLLAAKMEAALALPPPRTVHLAQLARENTRAVMTALEPGRHVVKPLDAESLSLVREATLSLLAEQKRLRAWLRDQKTNYEYQVGVQRKEIEELRPRVQQLTAQFESGRADQEAEAEAHCQTTARLAVVAEELSQTSLRLAVAEQGKQTSEERTRLLESEKADLQEKLAASKALYEATVADWTGYADEMDRSLTLYRSQRAWKGMLALRKAYILWVRKGWRFRILPWIGSALRGQGNVESEQLEFPVRPKPRE